MSRQSDEQAASLLGLLALSSQNLSLSVVVDLAVLAVDEVSAGLLLDLLLVARGGGGGARLHHGDVAAAPVDDQGLADQEEHDGDLKMQRNWCN